MPDQMLLFDPWTERAAVIDPPHTPPETSRAAAEAVKPDAARLRQAVLRYIQSRGPAGATDQEIQAALGLAGDTQRPRRWELQKADLIHDSGQRRKTSSGREAIVWTYPTP